jgi:hypothetical protein
LHRFGRRTRVEANQQLKLTGGSPPVPRQGDWHKLLSPEWQKLWAAVERDEVQRIVLDYYANIDQALA